VSEPKIHDRQSLLNPSQRQNKNPTKGIFNNSLLKQVGNGTF